LDWSHVGHGRGGNQHNDWKACGKSIGRVDELSNDKDAANMLGKEYVDPGFQLQCTGKRQQRTGCPECLSRRKGATNQSPEGTLPSLICQEQVQKT
jgi:hypothetical protein